MRTIVVYGGAFNPPTIAHQRILQASIDWAEARDHPEVWVLPSGENNKKKTGISRTKRLEYCRALIASVKPKKILLRTELLEIDDTRRTDKVETAETLMRQNPDAEFWWIYGADSIETIDLWGGEWLKTNTNMLIALRDGSTLDTIPERSEVMLVDTSGLLSSTAVRSMIARGENYLDAVPHEVASTIDPEIYQTYIPLLEPSPHSEAHQPNSATP